MEQSIIKNYNPAMSEDITALASAFLLAKNEFRATGLGGVNAHQKYNYAKIADIYHAVEGALSKNNIIIWHFAQPQDGIEYLHTRLIHTLTGQFIEDCRILESEKPGNQARGAANTYMKKYALLSLCAIATEDDDGEAEQKDIEKKQNNAYLTKDDVDEIIQNLKTCANAKTLHDSLLLKYKVASLNQLPYSSYDIVKQFIEDNRK
jgi:hypothetical protein